MRKLFSLAAAMGLFLGVGAAQPAHALPQALTSASLSLTISALPPIVIPWNHTGSATLTATTITGLTAGIFNFAGSLPVTDPGAFPIAGLAVTGVTNAVGNLTNVNVAGNVGPMAIQGVANVCLFAGCAGPPANVTVPFTTAGVNGQGLGGAPIAVIGLVNVTVNGNVWTTGTATVGAASQSGSPLDASGHIKLISPSLISTNIGASAVLPMFAVMELQFEVVPEPGTLLLLVSGVAGLAIVGRKRMSK